MQKTLFVLFAGFALLGSSLTLASDTAAPAETTAAVANDETWHRWVFLGCMHTQHECDHAAHRAGYHHHRAFHDHHHRYCHDHGHPWACFGSN